MDTWIKILPGEYYVTRSNEAITTVLGSCIAACIRDPVTGIGGMNHFMLPRCGSHAMQSLVNGVLKLGAHRDRLEVKLFGAGRILAAITDVGARNIEFIRNYCKSEGLRVVAEDLGDICPRQVAFFPATGRARVRHLKPLEATR